MRLHPSRNLNYTEVTAQFGLQVFCFNTAHQNMKLKSSIISEIKSIIAKSQQQAIRSVNTQRVLMYWEIGRVIFVEEQGSKARAEYGSFFNKIYF